MKSRTVTNVAVFGVHDDERWQEVHAAVVHGDHGSFDTE
jgi:hypothetical protein